MWRVAVVAPDAASADSAAAALGAACATVSAFRAPPGEGWQVEGFAGEKPQAALIEAIMALAWAARGTAPPAISIERVAERDWLAENQASFPPLAAGRYFIHGSHHARGVPAGRIGLIIDAATAFGTGEHASTRGCLLALDGIARRRVRRRVLDMGAGTGILAIAAAKTWRRRVWASDIDAEAVRVTARNAAANGVASLVGAHRADGYRDRGLRRAGRFDLVLANILARPLMLMAKDLARALAPGGIAVLSGLLQRQAPAVLAAHRAQGLHLLQRIVLDDWHTLVLARPSRRGAAHRSSG